jgi:hypothetical protein
MSQCFYQCAFTSSEGGKLLENVKEINTKEVIYWKAQIRDNIKQKYWQYLREDFLKQRKNPSRLNDTRSSGRKL